jgi:hypothetical protein
MKCSFLILTFVVLALAQSVGSAEAQSATPIPGSSASDSSKDSGSWIETSTAVVSAVAAVIAVVVAGWSIFEGRRLYLLQTSPEIVIYIGRNERFHDAADLVITNIGLAPAVDVRFHWPEDTKLFGLYEGQRESIYILDKGIKFLPPGQRYSYSVGVFRDMDQSETTGCVSYYRHGDTNRRRQLSEKFLLRPKELMGMAEWNDREKEAQIALSKAMDALRLGRITVKTRDVTPPDEDYERKS